MQNLAYSLAFRVQKLVHVRTLNKMTTVACHTFLTVDGIEPHDIERLKTLNFDRYFSICPAF